MPHVPSGNLVDERVVARRDDGPRVVGEHVAAGPRSPMARQGLAVAKASRMADAIACGDSWGTTNPHPAGANRCARSDSASVAASTAPPHAMMRYTFDGTASLPVAAACETTDRCGRAVDLGHARERLIAPPGARWTGCSS